MRFIVVLAVVCLGFASASLINILKTVHQNPTFSHLPHATQIIIIELIAETEAGELKNYIDLVGFQHVLAAIDRKLTVYLRAGVTQGSTSSWVKMLDNYLIQGIPVKTALFFL